MTHRRRALVRTPTLELPTPVEFKPSLEWLIKSHQQGSVFRTILGEAAANHQAQPAQLLCYPVIFG
jgi:hypothetical protein